MTDVFDEPDDRCGTYAGWNVHQKAGERPCQPCRTAATEYAANYRQDPEVRQREKTHADARRRALTRLRAMHPAEYRVLYEEELAR